MNDAVRRRRIGSSMELHEASQEELRRLSRMGGAGRRVLSVYLRVDPPRASGPHVRRLELGARLSEAERRLRHEGGEAAAETALDSCLGRVRRELEDAPLPDHTTQAVAVFCEDSGELRAYALRHPPDFAVAAAFREAATVEPLVEALPGPRWAVALVSRKHGRIFAGTEAALAEVSDVDDEVHRWHAQGGWSQARFQRGIEKEARDHVGRVCERLFALHRSRPVDRLVVGGPAEIWPLIDARLHPYLRERLAGHAEIDVERSTPEQVLEHVGALMAEERARREREAIGQVMEGLGTGSRSVAGPDDVRAALDDRRVATLLVSKGSTEDRLERAVEDALAQSAEIVVVESEALDSLGEIAALLRY
jgi:peptide chain release factor subunit 1